MELCYDLVNITLNPLNYLVFMPYMDSSATVISHAGHKFHEVFQHKQGSYTDLPASRISEMMKSNSLDVSSPNIVRDDKSLSLRVLAILFVLCLCDGFKVVSLAECSDTVAVKCCQRHSWWKRGDEEWSNTLCMWWCWNPTTESNSISYLTEFSCCIFSASLACCEKLCRR